MRISLLIDSPLATLAQAMRGLDSEIRKQITVHTKKAAQPIWQETTREQAMTRMESRLAQSARTGVTAQNVFLRAGTVGRLSSGTSISDLARAIEHGINPGKEVRVTRNGKSFTRRMGSRFRPNKRGGYVAYPAAKVSIPRIASLWIQTAIRTIHETIEKV